MTQSVPPEDIETQPNAKIVFNAPNDDNHTYHAKVINSSARRNKITKRKATVHPSHAMLTRSRTAHQQQAQRSSSATSSSSSRSLKPATSRKGTPVKKSRGLGATAKRRMTRVAEEEEREERRRTMMKMARKSAAPSFDSPPEKH